MDAILITKLEDLVFFPQLVLGTICQCVGGSMRHPLILRGDTNKKEPSKVHGSIKTDLRAAMSSHIYTSNHRTQGMTFRDIEYASHILQDSTVVHALGYRADRAAPSGAKMFLTLASSFLDQARKWSN